MEYKDWCLHSKEILAEAKEYNDWADTAKKHLLTNVGPRLAALSETGYMGCGFHYSLEQSFGQLFTHMAIPWQPCANWCQHVERDRKNSIITEVIYRGLLDSIVKAEESLPQFRKLCELGKGGEVDKIAKEP